MNGRHHHNGNPLLSRGERRCNPPTLPLSKMLTTLAMVVCSHLLAAQTTPRMAGTGILSLFRLFRKSVTTSGCTRQAHFHSTLTSFRGKIDGHAAIFGQCAEILEDPYRGKPPYLGFVISKYMIWVLPSKW